MASHAPKWDRRDERQWLRTLSSEQLAKYRRTIVRRAVDFWGKPVTPEFQLDCALDADDAERLSG